MKGTVYVTAVRMVSKVMGLLQRLDASLLDMAQIAVIVFTCVTHSV